MESHHQSSNNWSHYYLQQPTKAKQFFSINNKQTKSNNSSSSTSLQSSSNNYYYLNNRKLKINKSLLPPNYGKPNFQPSSIIRSRSSSIKKLEDDKEQQQKPDNFNSEEFYENNYQNKSYLRNPSVSKKKNSFKGVQDVEKNANYSSCLLSLDNNKKQQQEEDHLTSVSGNRNQNQNTKNHTSLLDWVESELDQLGVDSVIYGRHLLSLLQQYSSNLEDNSTNDTAELDSGYGSITANTNLKYFYHPQRNNNRPSITRYCESHQKLYPGSYWNTNRKYNSSSSLTTRPKDNTQKAPSTTKWMHKRYLQQNLFNNKSINHSNNNLSSPSYYNPNRRTEDNNYDNYEDNDDDIGFDHHCPDCQQQSNKCAKDYRKFLLIKCLKSAVDKDSFYEIESFIEELCLKYDQIELTASTKKNFKYSGSNFDWMNNESLFGNDDCTFQEFDVQRLKRNSKFKSSNIKHNQRLDYDYHYNEENDSKDMAPNEENVASQIGKLDNEMISNNKFITTAMAIQDQAKRYYDAFPALSASTILTPPKYSSNSSPTGQNFSQSSIKSESYSSTSSTKISNQSSLDDSVFLDIVPSTSNKNIENNISINQTSNFSGNWNGKKIIKNIVQKNQEKFNFLFMSTNLNPNSTTLVPSTKSDNQLINQNKPTVMKLKSALFSGKSSRTGLIVDPACLTVADNIHGNGPKESSLTTLKKLTTITNNYNSNNQQNSISNNEEIVNNKDKKKQPNFTENKSLDLMIQNQSTTTTTSTTATNTMILNSTLSAHEMEKIYQIMPSFLNPTSKNLTTTVTTTTTTTTITTSRTSATSTTTTATTINYSPNVYNKNYGYNQQEKYTNVNHRFNQNDYQQRLNQRKNRTFNLNNSNLSLPSIHQKFYEQKKMASTHQKLFIVTTTATLTTANILTSTTTTKNQSVIDSDERNIVVDLLPDFLKSKSLPTSTDDFNKTISIDSNLSPTDDIVEKHLEKQPKNLDIIDDICSHSLQLSEDNSKAKQNEETTDCNRNSEIQIGENLQNEIFNKQELDSTSSQQCDDLDLIINSEFTNKNQTLNHQPSLKLPLHKTIDKWLEYNEQRRCSKESGLNSNFPLLKDESISQLTSEKILNWRPLSPFQVNINDELDDSILQSSLVDDHNNFNRKRIEFLSTMWDQNCTLGYMDFMEKLIRNEENCRSSTWNYSDNTDDKESVSKLNLHLNLAKELSSIVDFVHQRAKANGEDGPTQKNGINDEENQSAFSFEVIKSKDQEYSQNQQTKFFDNDSMKFLSDMFQQIEKSDLYSKITTTKDTDHWFDVLNDENQDENSKCVCIDNAHEITNVQHTCNCKHNKHYSKISGKIDQQQIEKSGTDFISWQQINYEEESSDSNQLINIDELINDVLSSTDNDDAQNRSSTQLSKDSKQYFSISMKDFSSSIVTTSKPDADLDEDKVTQSMKIEDDKETNVIEQQKEPSMPYSKRYKLKIKSPCVIDKNSQLPNNENGTQSSSTYYDHNYSLMDDVNYVNGHIVTANHDLSLYDNLRNNYNNWLTTSSYEENAGHYDAEYNYYYDQNDENIVDPYGGDNGLDFESYGNDLYNFDGYLINIPKINNEFSKSFTTTSTTLSSNFNKTSNIYNGIDIKFKLENRFLVPDSDAKPVQKPCAFFLENSCVRVDCKFSHDLSSIPCKYYNEGACYKEEFCPFLHEKPKCELEQLNIDTSSSLSKLDPNAKSFQFKIESDSDFPSLFDGGNINDLGDQLDSRVNFVFKNKSNVTGSTGEDQLTKNNEERSQNVSKLILNNNQSINSCHNFAQCFGAKDTTRKQNKSLISMEAEEEWPSLSGKSDEMESSISGNLQQAGKIKNGSVAAATAKISKQSKKTTMISLNNSNNRNSINFRDKVLMKSSATMPIIHILKYK